MHELQPRARVCCYLHNKTLHQNGKSRNTRTIFYFHKAQNQAVDGLRCVCVSVGVRAHVLKHEEIKGMMNSNVRRVVT